MFNHLFASVFLMHGTNCLKALILVRLQAFLVVRTKYIDIDL